MKKLSYLLLIVIAISTSSCVSTSSSLKNVNNKAPVLTLTKDNTFVLSKYSEDKKYGFDPDYPINLFFKNTKDENLNSERFLKALAGPKGETITYTKLESCCPFPTIRNEMGAGFLDVYEVTWEGNEKPLRLYLNIYEKGDLFVPVGLSIKK